MDADWWSAELGLLVPPGLFGENLRTRGLDVSGALVGERWRIGTVLLQVRMPRTPCHNLSLRVGIEGVHVRVNDSGRVGALLKVLEPGTLEAGSAIEIVERPRHDVTVAVLARGPNAEQMRRMLASEVPLAEKVRARAHRLVSHG